jgi:hypothetical protein
MFIDFQVRAVGWRHRKVGFALQSGRWKLLGGSGSVFFVQV